MKMIAPPGWSPATISRRFATVAPSSYNADLHSCVACISTGAPVKRIFGTEILSISRDAVDLSRVPCPLLDSHSQASIDNVLGRVTEAWISGGELLGRIVFARTSRGRAAEGMVGRNEVTGISAGYSIEKWSCVDADGDAVDPSRADWDSDLTFTAVRWRLLETSLVGIGADSMAGVRSFASGGADTVDDIRQRMMIRARVTQRQRMHNAQQAVFGGHDD
jgi:hypothetical protein